MGAFERRPMCSGKVIFAGKELHAGLIGAAWGAVFGAVLD